MRLDKLLANTGYGSRKDVKQLIKKNHVIVNDDPVKDNGLHVNPEQDEIYVNGEQVYYRKFIYIMMNKPQGYISATYDAKMPTVIDLLSEEDQLFKPFPAGRLDKDTEGLLLITNDGDLGHQLTSPKKAVEKVYYAKIYGHVSDNDVRSFRRGIELDNGYVTRPSYLEVLKADNYSEAYVTITEGKYHQIKRMFESLGHEVVFLKRIQMGNLELDNDLEAGEYRELFDNELARLTNDV